MKIEIEFQEVELLKNSLRNAELELQKLRKREKDLDELERKFHQRVMAKSFVLLDELVAKVFKDLGFDPIPDDQVFYYGKNRAVQISQTLKESLANKISSIENLEVNLNVSINEQFRRAFLKIGVIAPSELKKEGQDK